MVRKRQAEVVSKRFDEIFNAAAASLLDDELGSVETLIDSLYNYGEMHGKHFRKLFKVETSSESESENISGSNLRDLRRDFKSNGVRRKAIVDVTAAPVPVSVGKGRNFRVAVEVQSQSTASKKKKEENSLVNKQYKTSGADRRRNRTSLSPVVESDAERSHDQLSLQEKLIKSRVDIPIFHSTTSARGNKAKPVPITTNKPVVKLFGLFKKDFIGVVANTGDHQSQSSFQLTDNSLCVDSLLDQSQGGGGYRASVVVCGRVVALGTFDTATEAAKAHDRALIRATGPSNCLEEDLNFDVECYAQDSLEEFYVYDTVLRQALFASSWHGPRPCDFGFLMARFVDPTLSVGLSAEYSPRKKQSKRPGTSYITQSHSEDEEPYFKSALTQERHEKRQKQNEERMKRLNGGSTGGGGGGGKRGGKTTKAASRFDVAGVMSGARKYTPRTTRNETINYSNKRSKHSAEDDEQHDHTVDNDDGFNSDSSRHSAPRDSVSHSDRRSSSGRLTRSLFPPPGPKQYLSEMPSPERGESLEVIDATSAEPLAHVPKVGDVIEIMTLFNAETYRAVVLTLHSNGGWITVGLPDKSTQSVRGRFVHSLEDEHVTFRRNFFTRKSKKNDGTSFTKEKAMMCVAPENYSEGDVKMVALFQSSERNKSDKNTKSTVMNTTTETPKPVKVHKQRGRPPRPKITPQIESDNTNNTPIVVEQDPGSMCPLWTPTTATTQSTSHELSSEQIQAQLLAQAQYQHRFQSLIQHSVTVVGGTSSRDAARSKIMYIGPDFLQSSPLLSDSDTNPVIVLPTTTSTSGDFSTAIFQQPSPMQAPVSSPQHPVGFKQMQLTKKQRAAHEEQLKLKRKQAVQQQQVQSEQSRRAVLVPQPVMRQSFGGSGMQRHPFQDSQLTNTEPQIFQHSVDVNQRSQPQQAYVPLDQPPPQQAQVYQPAQHQEHVQYLQQQQQSAAISQRKQQQQQYALDQQRMQQQYEFQQQMKSPQHASQQDTQLQFEAYHEKMRRQAMKNGAQSYPAAHEVTNPHRYPVVPNPHRQQQVQQPQQQPVWTQYPDQAGLVNSNTSHGSSVATTRALFDQAVAVKYATISCSSDSVDSQLSGNSNVPAVGGIMGVYSQFNRDSAFEHSWQQSHPQAVAEQIRTVHQHQLPHSHDQPHQNVQQIKQVMAHLSPEMQMIEQQRFLKRQREEHLVLLNQMQQNPSQNQLYDPQLQTQAGQEHHRKEALLQDFMRRQAAPSHGDKSSLLSPQFSFTRHPSHVAAPVTLNPPVVVGLVDQHPHRVAVSPAVNSSSSCDSSERAFVSLEATQSSVTSETQSSAENKSDRHVVHNMDTGVEEIHKSPRANARKRSNSAVTESSSNKRSAVEMVAATSPVHSNTTAVRVTRHSPTSYQSKQHTVDVKENTSSSSSSSSAVDAFAVTPEMLAANRITRDLDFFPLEDWEVKNIKRNWKRQTQKLAQKAKQIQQSGGVSASEGGGDKGNATDMLSSSASTQDSDSMETEVVPQVVSSVETVPVVATTSEMEASVVAKKAVNDDEAVREIHRIMGMPDPSGSSSSSSSQQNHAHHMFKISAERSRAMNILIGSSPANKPRSSSVGNGMNSNLSKLSFVKNHSVPQQQHSGQPVTARNTSPYTVHGTIDSVASSLEAMSRLPGSPLNELLTRDFTTRNAGTQGLILSVDVNSLAPIPTTSSNLFNNSGLNSPRIVATDPRKRHAATTFQSIAAPSSLFNASHASASAPEVATVIPRIESSSCSEARTVEDLETKTITAPTAVPSVGTSQSAPTDAVLHICETDLSSTPLPISFDSCCVLAQLVNASAARTSFEQLPALQKMRHKLSVDRAFVFSELHNSIVHMMSKDFSRLVSFASAPSNWTTLSGVEQILSDKEEGGGDEALTWVASVPIFLLSGGITGGDEIGLRRIGYFSSLIEAVLVRETILRTRKDGHLPLSHQLFNLTVGEWKAVLRMVSLLEEFVDTHCLREEEKEDV